MGNEQIEFTHKYLSVGYIKTLCDHEKQFERALHCLDNLKNHTLQIGNDVNEVKAECKCRLNLECVLFISSMHT